MVRSAAARTTMSNLTTRVYELNAPDVVSETFEDQAVILNLATGHYYSLGGIAGGLWNLVISQHSTDAILASVAAQQPHLVKPASDFVAELLSFGLIKESQVPSSEGAIDVTWANEPPKLDAFEDLAELIAADPVHDVDVEAGWPVLRPQP